MSRVLQMLGVQSKPQQPNQQQASRGSYQTLFRKLLAELPPELTNDSPLIAAQLKVIRTAIGQMSEENAALMAHHIKELAKTILIYETTIAENDTSEAD